MYNQVSTKKHENNLDVQSHLSPKKKLGTNDHLPAQFIVLRYWDGKKYKSKFLKISDDPKEVEIGAVQYYYVRERIYNLVDKGDAKNTAKKMHEEIQKELESQHQKLSETPGDSYTENEVKIPNGANVFKGKRVNDIEDLKETNPSDYRIAKTSTGYTVEEGEDDKKVTRPETIIESLNRHRSGEGFKTSAKVSIPPMTLSPIYDTNEYSIPSGLNMIEKDIETMNGVILRIIKYVKNFNLKINLTGHTDRTGEEGVPEIKDANGKVIQKATENYLLSLNRAKGMKRHMMNPKFFKGFALKEEDFGDIVGKGEDEAKDVYNKKLSEAQAPINKRITQNESKITAIKKIIKVKSQPKEKIAGVTEAVKKSMSSYLFNKYISLTIEGLKDEQTKLEKKNNVYSNIDVSERKGLKELLGKYDAFRKIDISFERKYNYLK